MDAIFLCCFAAAATLGVIAAGSGVSHAQPLTPPLWQPQRHVELIVPSAAGGGLDRTARTVHRIWQDHKLLPTANAVVNKPGGAGTISYTYLNQFAGDAHYVSVSSPTLLTNHILGTSRLTHSDFTPLAQLSSEYLMLLVRSDGPLKTAKEIFERLKKDPGALSIAIGSVPGGSNHIGIARVLKAAGIDVVTDTWRGVVGPKGLTPAQRAYWDGIFSKLAQSREWREEIEKHHGLDTYRDSAASRKFLDADYQVLKSALTDLGLVK